MHSGQLVFAQVMAYLPIKAFSRMVTARRAQHKVQDFSCLDQFLVLAFAQLTARESLRYIVINLRAQRKNFYHMGLRCKTVSRNTLANANRVRQWKVFCRFGPSPDQNGAHTFSRRADDLGAERADGSDGLCAGFDDDRLVLEPVQLGAFPNHQGCRQASYAHGFEGFDSEYYPHQRRQDARRQSSRPALRARLHRGWRVLRHGQSLRRLCMTLQAAMASGTVLQMDQTASSNQGFLRHDRKRRQDADLGRHCDLCVDCHYEEAVESETFVLRNSPCTGPQHV
jgi:hypothetical protein